MWNYAGSQDYRTGDGFTDDPNNSVDKIMTANEICHFTQSGVAAEWRNLLAVRSVKGLAGVESGEIVLGVESGSATHASGANGLAVSAVDAIAGGEYTGGGGSG